MVIYRIALDGLLLVIDRHLDKLPFPLSCVAEPKEILKHLLSISIGYEDRRSVGTSRLGQILYNGGMIPHAVDSFIIEALESLETQLLKGGQLRLHYSEHTYELGLELIVYQTSAIKPAVRLVSNREQTEYHQRLLREQQLDQEREEAYAQDTGRYYPRYY